MASPARDDAHPSPTTHATLPTAVRRTGTGPPEAVPAGERVALLRDDVATRLAAAEPPPPEPGAAVSSRPGVSAATSPADHRGGDDREQLVLGHVQRPLHNIGAPEHPGADHRPGKDRHPGKDRRSWDEAIVATDRLLSSGRGAVAAVLASVTRLGGPADQ